ncbi:T9SS type A sorting domain-containing protein [Flavobacterium sp. MK4S-17]|uniref:T9SS type A sorting domain-containing protein n=1 Tax=Flavobacterium sp. MK4S-17 TaxID=2543737 RepID=UPI00135763A9|nr:T9SS type A sorting domain-containing protein [Flavobacterium sp. MK4S-17]
MMKKLLHYSLLFFTGLSLAQDYTTVNIAMQPSYASQVYYKFATNTQTPVAAASWDIAFEKASGMGIGTILVNDGAGIKLFEASNSASNWQNIDVANEANWIELYNSDTEWAGAFDKGSNSNPPFGFGWGSYNIGTHHINGTIIFVLKYADNTYKKIIIEDYDPFTGITTFKYASWDGTAWSSDETGVVSASNNAGYSFNYYSLANGLVTAAPEDTAWDIVFRKYYTNLGTEDNPIMYSVTGALHSNGVSVAQIDETGNTQNDPALPAEGNYSANINTIGDDWKTFDMTSFSYVVDPETTFYVKDAAGNIYRMYFTSFAGQSTGNLSFNYKDVTATAGFKDLNNNMSFGLYPNPSTDKRVTVIYDLKNSTPDKNIVTIYSIAGAKVYETEITNNSGFYTKELNLSQLSPGMYIVQFKSGNASQSKKLIIK